MAQCVALAQSSDGITVLTPVDVPECTSLLLLTPAEYSALVVNPFHLSIEDGALISGAIGAVWVLAWAVRAIRAALSPGGDSND